MLRNVLDASATTFCAASSQLFGDSESISITFTIFGMSLISFPPSVSHHLGNMAASTVWLAGRKGACSRMAGKLGRRPAVAEPWHGRRSGALQLLAEGTRSSCPKLQAATFNQQQKRATLPRLPAESFPALSPHQSVW